MINWDDPQEHVSKFFTVHECLWLPRWSRMANNDDGFCDKIGFNLIDLCMKLDLVRDFMKDAMIVHCMFRPFAYNHLVLGAYNSPHTRGQACDFHFRATDCDQARQTLVPKLQEFNLRMEDLPGAAWVHLDTADVVNHRYFKP